MLRDALLASQTAASLRAVLAPKLSGSLTATAALCIHPVQHILLFSSVAALMGNAGQANYAAANATLDAMGQMLQQQGAPTGSLQWGPWAGSGMASPVVAARLAAQGVGLVTPLQGLGLLHTLLDGVWAPAILAPLVALDWGRMLRAAPRQSAFFGELAVISTPAAPAAQPPALQPLAPRVPKQQQLLAEVLDVLAGVLGAAIEPHAAFMSAGLDSLGAGMDARIPRRFPRTRHVQRSHPPPSPSSCPGFCRCC